MRNRILWSLISFILLAPLAGNSAETQSSTALENCAKSIVTQRQHSGKSLTYTQAKEYCRCMEPVIDRIADAYSKNPDMSKATFAKLGEQGTKQCLAQAKQ